MKGKTTEEALPPSRSSQTLTLNKAQKRPARVKPTGAAAKKLRKEPNRAMPTATPKPPQQQPNPSGSSSSPLPEEVSLCFDGALELDGYGWCWGAVDEEKLLGWFPFVDEDFPCFCSENRSSFFWEDYHDIWHLKHIHEIPSSANR